MKKTLFTLLPLAELLAVVALLYGCSNLSARLAQDVAGDWQSTPESLSDNGVLTASIVDFYDFGEPGASDNGSYTGPLSINGMINITTQIAADSTGVQPTELSASARSSVSGTWTVIDDDEIVVSLDLSTISVDVDPQGVALNVPSLGGREPAVDSISANIAASIKASLAQALTLRYGKINHLDDVKVKGNLLKYEIGHEDFVLTRQSQTAE